MKKNFLFIIVFFLVIGCTNNNIPNDVEEKKIEINYDSLLDGNYEILSGTYINSSGEIINLDDNACRSSNEVSSKKAEKLEIASGGYMIDIYSKEVEKDGNVYGILMYIFPEGVEIPTLESDTSILRISYGQDYPCEIENVYYKK